jgi:hypothetical protein
MSSSPQTGPTDEQPAHDRSFAAVRATFSAWETIETEYRHHTERHEGARDRRWNLTDPERATMYAVQEAYLRGFADGTAVGMGTTPADAARLHHQQAFMEDIEDRAQVILHYLAIKNSPRRQIIGIARELLAVVQAIRSQPVALWPTGWHETPEDAAIRRRALRG